MRLAGTLLGLAVALGACNSTSGELVTAAVPEDYRLRHPIAVEEGKQSMVVFVGQGRGGLSASQRADVAGLARVGRIDRHIGHDRAGSFPHPTAREPRDIGAL